MRKKLMWAAVLAAAVGGGLTGYRLAFAGGGTANPVDPNRPDCPGQIVCPLSGELVWRDRCPVGGDTAQPKDEACCCCARE